MGRNWSRLQIDLEMTYKHGSRSVTVRRGTGRWHQRPRRLPCNYLLVHQENQLCPNRIRGHQVQDPGEGSTSPRTDDFEAVGPAVRAFYIRMLKNYQLQNAPPYDTKWHDTAIIPRTHTQKLTENQLNIGLRACPKTETKKNLKGTKTKTVVRWAGNKNATKRGSWGRQWCDL